MALKSFAGEQIPADLVDKIRTFPTRRELEHCGTRFSVSPLDFYARCPTCNTTIKTRGFSANIETADVIDAVLEWMNQPETHFVVDRRRQQIAADRE